MESDSKCIQSNILYSRQPDAPGKTHKKGMKAAAQSPSPSPSNWYWKRPIAFEADFILTIIPKLCEQLLVIFQWSVTSAQTANAWSRKLESYSFIHTQNWNPKQVKLCTIWLWKNKHGFAQIASHRQESVKKLSFPLHLNISISARINDALWAGNLFTDHRIIWSHFLIKIVHCARIDGIFKKQNQMVRWQA